MAVAAVVFGGSREPGIGMVSLCAIGAILAGAGAVLWFWGLAYRRLQYVLTDNALRIDWLGRTTVVPYGAIQGIYTGQRLTGAARPQIPRWPGINVGPARVRGLGRLRFFATSSNQAALTLITVEAGGVIVSAGDPQAFRAALIERVEAAEDAFVGEPAAWHQTPPRVAPWTAIADPWLAVCVALGMLMVLLVMAVIGVRFDALPDQIVMHFDANGRPSQIASKFDLLRLPLFGLFILAVDWGLGVWAHARDRLLGRLLWVGGVLVQVVLLVGVLRLVA
ncbi:MAG TPA: PH domain-containing protein [Chloroflexota bacterium]|nr:PH domain-containing protein [Chloroflexota bacterium]